MEIMPAKRSQARQVARLVMLAMDHDCCRHFMGPGHSLSEFEDVMTALVEREDSQYSYLNTLVAVDGGDEPLGICVAYDGARLVELRRAFLDAMAREFGRDHGGMEDETSAGEFYVDSLAVREDMRGRGIATALLGAAAARCGAMGIPALGLLVDRGNPGAMRLYRRVGFRHVGDSTWGGHPMMRLRMAVTDT